MECSRPIAEDATIALFNGLERIWGTLPEDCITLLEFNQIFISFVFNNHALPHILLEPFVYAIGQWEYVQGLITLQDYYQCIHCFQEECDTSDINCDFLYAAHECITEYIRRPSYDFYITFEAFIKDKMFNESKYLEHYDIRRGCAELYREYVVSLDNL